MLSEEDIYKQLRRSGASKEIVVKRQSYRQVHVLKQKAKKVLTLYRNMIKAFEETPDESLHLIAIMAGLKDAYEAGYEMARHNSEKMKRVMRHKSIAGKLYIDREEEEWIVKRKSQGVKGGVLVDKFPTKCLALEYIYRHQT